MRSSQTLKDFIATFFHEQAELTFDEDELLGFVASLAKNQRTMLASDFTALAKADAQKRASLLEQLQSAWEFDQSGETFDLLGQLVRDIDQVLAPD